MPPKRSKKAESSSDSDEGPVDEQQPSGLENDWSVEDKTTFLKVVKTYGLSNMHQICQALPNHTKADIETFIKDRMKLRIRYKTAHSVISRSNKRPKPILLHVKDKPCLDKWINILLKSRMEITKHFNPLSFCMKLISDFEEHNGSEDNVNFKSLYLYLSHCLQGLNPCELNEDTEMYLHKVLEYLAAEHRDPVAFQEDKVLLNSIRPELNSSKVFKNYGTHTGSISTSIENIQDCKELNPFNIPLDKIIR